MPLELLFDMEIVDSKIEAAFDKQHNRDKKMVVKKKPFIEYYI